MVLLNHFIDDVVDLVTLLHEFLMSFFSEHFLLLQIKHNMKAKEHQTALKMQEPKVHV
jgi:hypothetical protein